MCEKCNCAASQQAAEPVAYHTRDGKMLAFAGFIKPECRADMVPLYRAAPPQQVDTEAVKRAIFAIPHDELVSRDIIIHEVLNALKKGGA